MTLIALLSHSRHVSWSTFDSWDSVTCVTGRASFWSQHSPLIGQLSQILWSDWPRIASDTIMTHEEKWSNIAFALQGPVNNWLHHSVINPADQGRDKADCHWSVLEETSILIGQDILTFRPTHQEDWLERGATIWLNRQFPLIFSFWYDK